MKHIPDHHEIHIREGCRPFHHKAHGRKMRRHPFKLHRHQHRFLPHHPGIEPHLIELLEEILPSSARISKRRLTAAATEEQQTTAEASGSKKREKKQRKGRLGHKHRKKGHKHHRNGKHFPPWAPFRDTSSSSEASSSSSSDSSDSSDNSSVQCNDAEAREPTKEIGDERRSSDFQLSVDVSSYMPDEIKIKLEGRTLTIKGDHTENRLQGDVSMKLRKKFQQEVELGENVDMDRLWCELAGDMLKITAPIKEPEMGEPKSLPIHMENPPTTGENQEERKGSEGTGATSMGEVCRINI